MPGACKRGAKPPSRTVRAVSEGPLLLVEFGSSFTLFAQALQLFPLQVEIGAGDFVLPCSSGLRDFIALRLPLRSFAVSEELDQRTGSQLRRDCRNCR